ncbi:iron(III) transport system substrate-binding protein [Enhydrobacter aerosaccus]|uniref:Iron(III) transport system substrate-binding protein n=1 Tax=Enhydrobacter aerosaccus TaxID=225324 RepID=A0A1T4RKI4_9HYPH|nr:extracellular solute-binding protein [Enhydrobacter aerosaccus]SKA16492.1 iron(III) transport system substrate-binding protein [Enhydrobacter aerosaccus]
MTKRFRRRQLLAGGTALAATSFVTPVFGAPPEAQKITPDLVEAAKKEGKVTWYTSVDLALAEKVAKAFEAKYPGVTLRVERSGAERNFQRIGQEYASKIYNCDVVNSSDAAHFILWKRQGMLAPYLPEDVARDFPAEHKDPDGMFASWRVTVSPMAYNTKLVKADDAPKSYAELVDPKWSGKIVKAHPGYSGVIMTSTQQLARELGWPWFEKLAKQKVLQVQSATEPPKKLAQGERAIMADGGEYVVTELKAKGEPVELIYASEGTPLITGPSGIMAQAPNPNAARLFQAWSMTAEAQQLNVDVGALRSAHPRVKDRPDMRKFSEIKTMREEATVVADKADEIKAHYVKLFKV